ncbi:MAG: hypothetical protein JJU00_01235 [Opitutales bacterium]|nr:hypothetical protein [Opitutales bacterium]
MEHSINPVALVLLVGGALVVLSAVLCAHFTQRCAQHLKRIERLLSEARERGGPDDENGFPPVA